MDSENIVQKLKSFASEKHKENIIKLGILEQYCIGVPTGFYLNGSKYRVYEKCFR